MLEPETLTRLLERAYATRINQLQPLASGDKQVYRAQHTTGVDWVVRVYPPASFAPVSAAVTQAELLVYLADQGYPAERVIHTIDGRRVVAEVGHTILVTTYLGASLQSWQPETGSTGVSPASTSDSPATFAALGALLGRLHSLPRPEVGMHRPAGMLPQRELTWVAEELASVDGQVPPAFQAEYAALVLALQQASRCADAPQTLIHNDCNLGNVVVTSDQTLALVDWDMAGLGPAVVDLGILLRNCFDKQQLRVRPNNVLAVVEGYCQQRRLTELELDRLPDAIAFMTLVLLAAFFPARCQGELPATALIYGAPYAAWRAQYGATAEIAALTRKHFVTDHGRIS